MGALAPVIILGGIYGGVFTPTEASMVGVIYGVVAGCFIYRELGWRQLYETTLQSFKMSGMIVFIVAMAYGYAYLMANEGIPQQVVGLLLSLSDNPIVILLMINVLLLILTRQPASGRLRPGGLHEPSAQANTMVFALES